MFKRLFAALLVILSLGLSVAAAAEKNPVVLMETSMGNIKVELFADKAPLSVKNFLDYANSGFYKDTIFHRVIPGFMAQGGGLTAALQPKPGTNRQSRTKPATGLKMTGAPWQWHGPAWSDSVRRHSSSSTSSITISSITVTKPDGFGYAVFGKVIDGMDVVDKMVAAPQKQQNAVFQNVPETPIVIKSVKVLK